MIQWHFAHPDTDEECVATYDGAILKVRSAAYAADPDEIGDDPTFVYGSTAGRLEAAGLLRTYCPSIDAARRELRAIGVEAGRLR